MSGFMGMVYYNVFYAYIHLTPVKLSFITSKAGHNYCNYSANGEQIQPNIVPSQNQSNHMLEVTLD